MADNISELVARILDTLGSSVLEEISWISGVPDELRRIKQTLLAINAVLLDAQEQQSSSKSTRLWLQNLKLVAYDIEDVLDLITTQDLELKVNGRSLFRKITKLFTRYDVARELKVIRHRLDEVEHNRKSFSFQERHMVPSLVETTMQRETYSYVRESDVIGRKEDKERIINVLMRSSSHDVQHLSVIPITGLGGMGKTTLAKLIFNDPEVIERFELRLWAHVSSKFVLKILIANILRIATGMNFSNSNLELLQDKLCEILGGKTYLLILDDVWIRDPREWMELHELLSVGSPRSKLIVTTREERVASITGTIEAYELKGLSDDHCWSIFAKYAFNKGECETYPLLVDIGKSIVQKCHGVPLAAKTLGSMLRHERDDQLWKQIKESELWKIKQGPNDILPALKLSYDQTPYQLRSCFALCAGYRKGYPLFRNDLVYMWMALGFLQSREEDEEPEAIGNKYFDELLSRSFFQLPNYDLAESVFTRYGELFDESGFWNDLARNSKSNLIDNLKLVIQAFFQPGEKSVFLEMHDLLYDLATYVSKEEIAIVTSNSQAISPRTQYISWDQEDLSTKGFPMHSLEASKARVFAFVHPMGFVSKSFLKGLISSFKCLRILNLNFSEFEELPDSIGSLKHLRFLNLEWNLKLARLPDSVCNLVNLQAVELFRCIQLKTLPKDVHKLVSLRYLSLTSKLISLPQASLCGLRSLRQLRFWFCHHLTSLSEEIGSLENLRRLEIFYCASITTLPNEIKYLTKLEEFKICYCRSLDLKGWKGLYGLKNLMLLDFRELPKLLAFPEGIDSCAHSLRYFIITRCDGLRALPEGLRHNISLSNLTLSRCPKLSALPRGMKSLTSLQKLSIDGCPEIRWRCEKDTGRDWHLISHIPEICIDHQVIQKSNKGQPD